MSTRIDATEVLYEVHDYTSFTITREHDLVSDRIVDVFYVNGREASRREWIALRNLACANDMVG